jgi:hypothetical protein
VITEQDLDARMKAIAAGGKTPSAPPSPPEDKDLDARMKAVAQGNNYDNFQVSPGNEPKSNVSRGPISYGVTGSWSAPSAAPIAPAPAAPSPSRTDFNRARFAFSEAEHPYLNYIPGVINRIGDVGTEMTSGFFSSLHHAATDPLTEEERKLHPSAQPMKRPVGAGGLEPIEGVQPDAGVFLRRLFGVKDSKDKFGQAIEEAKKGNFGQAYGRLVQSVPIAGPLATQLSEHVENKDLGGFIGTVLTAYGLPKAMDAATGVVSSSLSARSAQNALKARDLAANNLSTVIQGGIRSGSGFKAAGIYTPYLQSFMDRAGVYPHEILPSSGLYSDMERGGSESALTKLNSELRSQWRQSGKNPSQFVPQTDIHMALAEGAVNEAHAPIANAIRTVRNVAINGTKLGPNGQLMNAQENIIAALQAQRDALHPSQLSTYGPSYDKAISDVRTKGGTIGGLDDVRQDWNQAMSNFHSGTPSKMIDADAASAAVYNRGNNIIRSELYPTVESLTNRPGMPNPLSLYGQLESVVIQARDGVYLGRVQNANLGSNSAIQTYLNHAMEGPQLIVRGVGAPATTAISLGSRLLKKNEMGKFNEAFRKGLGDIRDFRRMDASAFPKNPSLAIANPLVQGPSSMVPSPPLPNVAGPPNPIPNSAPPAVIPGVLPNVTNSQPLLPHEIAAAEAAARAAAIQPSPPPFPVGIGLNTTGILSGGPLPHEVAAQEAAAAEAARNPIPQSQGLLSPVGVGLNTAIGPAEEPLTPLTHPLAGGYSAIKEQKTPSVRSYAGNKPSAGPGAPTELNVAKPPAPPPAPKAETATTKAESKPAAKAAPAKTKTVPVVKTVTSADQYLSQVQKEGAAIAPAAEPVKTTAPAKTEVKPPAAPKKAAPAKPKAEAKAPTPPPKPSDTAELKGPTVGDLVRQKEKLDDYVTNNPDHDPQVLDGLRKESAKLDVQIKKAIGDKSPTKPVEVSMKPETKAAAPAPPPAAPKVEAKPVAAPADDIEALKAKVKALEKEANSTPVVKAEAKPKAATAPKRAAAPKAPPQPVAQRPSMDVLRKRGVVTGDDLVHLASNGDREAGIALAKAESLHLNPNDAEALTNMYLNEFDSADLPGDIKDLHARVGRRFTKGK